MRQFNCRSSLHNVKTYQLNKTTISSWRMYEWYKNCMNSDEWRAILIKECCYWVQHKIINLKIHISYQGIYRWNFLYGFMFATREMKITINMTHTHLHVYSQRNADYCKCKMYQLQIDHPQSKDSTNDKCIMLLWAKKTDAPIQPLFLGYPQILTNEFLDFSPWT